MLKGKRIIVRPLEEKDLELLAQWRNAEANRPFFFNPWPVYLGGQKAWYTNLVADRNRMLMMIETLEGRPVGLIGLAGIDWRNQSSELGPGIIDPPERGNGYIEEAIELLVTYSFRELNLHRLYCECYPFNRVVELMKLFGFKQEGVLRQAAFARGKFHDKVILGLLREEWEADCADPSADD